jgi:S-adenosylmethionine:tRNA ribosyltransferase-isomerase
LEVSLEEIPTEFRLSSYDYFLPRQMIAQMPAPRRPDSRLLVLGRQEQTITHEGFENLLDHLDPSDILVVNDTKVLPARLFAKRHTGGKAEVFTVRIEGDRLCAMYRTRGRLREGEILNILDRKGGITDIVGRIVKVFPDGLISVELPINPRAVLSMFGHVPLPPYIKRKDHSCHENDIERYQTVYAENEGSVAAPTAGLHFDQDLLDKIRSKGVKVVPITLHVGPGTFKPVKTEDIRLHRVMPEYFCVSETSANEINKALHEKRRVVAVGTTVVRTLEHIASVNDGKIVSGEGLATLTILPNHTFRVVKAMVTNFHLPRSSLIILVCAFASRSLVMKAYEEAKSLSYRFYSYGDAMLIL